MATAFLPTIDDTRPRPRRPGDLPAIVAVQDPVVADTAVQGDLPVVAAPVDHPIDQDQTQGKVALPVIPATTAPVATPVATSGAEDDPVSASGLAAISNEASMASPMMDKVKADTEDYRNLEQKNRMHRDPATGQMVENTHSVWSRIAAAAMGWARGGLLGGIEAARNPHYFEDEKTDRERRDLLPIIAADEKVAQIEEQGNAAKMRAQGSLDQLKYRAQAAKQRFNDRLSLLAAQNKEQKPWEAPDGKMYWIDKKGNKIPMTEKDQAGNEMQIQNPDKVYYDTVSPLTGTPVRVRGDKLYSGESTVAAGNAQRQQAADTTNANNLLEVRKRNTQTINNYNQQMQQRIAQEAAIAGEAYSADPAVQGLNTKLQTLNNQVNSLDPTSSNYETTKQKLLTEIADTYKQHGAIIAKAEKSNQQLQALRRSPLQAPSLESEDIPKVKATQVGTSGKYAGRTFGDADLPALRKYFPKKSDADIKTAITTGGGQWQ